MSGYDVNHEISLLIGHIQRLGKDAGEGQVEVKWTQEKQNKTV